MMEVGKLDSSRYESKILQINLPFWHMHTKILQKSKLVGAVTNFGQASHEPPLQNDPCSVGSLYIASTVCDLDILSHQMVSYFFSCLDLVKYLSIQRISKYSFFLEEDRTGVKTLFKEVNYLWKKEVR